MPVVLVVVLVVVVGATAAGAAWISWKMEHRYREQQKSRVNLHNRFWGIINANFWDDDNDQSNRE